MFIDISVSPSKEKIEGYKFTDSVGDEIKVYKAFDDPVVLEIDDGVGGKCNFVFDSIPKLIEALQAIQTLKETE